MAWVWKRPKIEIDFSAEMDYEASAPMLGTEYLWNKQIDYNLRPVFRSRTGLKKFQNLHCPPIGVSPAIDDIWRDIILKFVPANRVQFLPIRLIARGETCDDYMWVIPFDTVRCIDPEKSKVTSKIERSDITLIFGVENIVHYPNCLGNLQMARDEQMASHLIISDDLKDALASTGESSMFDRPEDVWTISNLANKLKDIL